MQFLLELLADVLGFIVEPVFEWIVHGCIAVFESIGEMIEYRRLEREERTGKKSK